MPHPFAAAYSYCYAAENLTACRGTFAFPCLWHARNGPFLLRLTFLAALCLPLLRDIYLEPSLKLGGFTK